MAIFRYLQLYLCQLVYQLHKLHKFRICVMSHESQVISQHCSPCCLTSPPQSTCCWGNICQHLYPLYPSSQGPSSVPKVLKGVPPTDEEGVLRLGGQTPTLHKVLASQRLRAVGRVEEDHGRFLAPADGIPTELVQASTDQNVHIKPYLGRTWVTRC